MNISKIRPKEDNVLVRFAVHAMARQEERTAGGIIIPQAVEDRADLRKLEATVIATGPGRWSDTWAGHEKGANTAGDGFWVPMNPDIKPGARVLVENGTMQGCRVYGDDREEYRMVRESCIAAVVES